MLACIWHGRMPETEISHGRSHRASFAHGPCYLLSANAYGIRAFYPTISAGYIRSDNGVSRDFG